MFSIGGLAPSLKEGMLAQRRISRENSTGTTSTRMPRTFPSERYGGRSSPICVTPFKTG